MSPTGSPEPQLLKAPGRVLPTLNADGSRRWIRPRPFAGRFATRRRWVGWSLIVLFAGLPFVRIGAKPAILLDIAARRFTFFGTTFLATDGVLLMLLMLSIFVGIFYITALWGRVWCGWGCPQTVYMELLFRPLERWIEGGRAAQLKLDQQGPNARRLLKYAAFAVLAVALANVFLAYFVGTEKLGLWMTSAPWEQPVGFLVLSVTAALVFVDFAYFREQMCTVVCPYARLQSVMLDTKSLIVGYDAGRGEPRGRAKPRRRGAPPAEEEFGDCVDCGACVVTCPTGIDIREGLQLECVACAQCVDACDSVMKKFGRAPGLIRYDSQERLQPGTKSLRPQRARMIVYPLVLAALLAALITQVGGAREPDVTLLRGIGAPFTLNGDRVTNLIRVKVQNRADADASYQLSLEGAPRSTLIAPENPVEVPAGQQHTTTVFVTTPRAAFEEGSLNVNFRIRDGEMDLSKPYRLLGPKQSSPHTSPEDR